MRKRIEMWKTYVHIKNCDHSFVQTTNVSINEASVCVWYSKSWATPGTSASILINCYVQIHTRIHNQEYIYAPGEGYDKREFNDTRRLH